MIYSAQMDKKRAIMHREWGVHMQVIGIGGV